MTSELEFVITAWYTANSRDLPWRGPDASAWSVMVSEFMLQQTPVARVLPAYREWLARWPTPGALAAASPADAVRQWGRLGYPRRALRLHESARIIISKHDGHVPAAIEHLRELPGVGSYTAAAIAAFAYGQRHAVLDTNVRRVLARLASGRQYPAQAQTAAELALAISLLPPQQERRAAKWSVALMELGALICTAARPRCGECPVAAACAWRAAGHPASPSPRRVKPYQGSDRELRGRILAVLRDASGPVPQSAFDGIWPDETRHRRVLDGLIREGMATRLSDGMIALPGDS